jgi:uncharacterized membrane protein YqjE
MGNEPEPNLQTLYKQVVDHLETRWEYYSLLMVEKIATAAAATAGMLTLAAFGMIILLFLCMGFAFWLSERLNSPAAGFSLAGLIVIPIAALVYWWIRPMVRDRIIQNMLNDEHFIKPGKDRQPGGTPPTEE